MSSDYVLSEASRTDEINAIKAENRLLRKQLASAREVIETIHHGLPQPGEETAKVMQEMATRWLEENPE